MDIIYIALTALATGFLIGYLFSDRHRYHDKGDEPWVTPIRISQDNPTTTSTATNMKPLTIRSSARSERGQR